MLLRLQQQYHLLVTGRHSARRWAPNPLCSSPSNTTTCFRLAALRVPPAPQTAYTNRAARLAARALAAPPVVEPTTDAQPASHTLVNFYHLVELAQPFRMLRMHREFCENRDLTGRIYISKQGINAQYSGATEDALAYVEYVGCWMSIHAHMLSSMIRLDMPYM